MCCFVHEQDRRVGQERTCDAQPFLHSVGVEGRRRLASSSARSTSASTSRPSALRRVGASPAGARRRRGSRGPRCGDRTTDHRTERGRPAGGTTRDMSTLRPRTWTAPSAGREARQDSEERCLAGTVGPEQGVDRTRLRRRATPSRARSLRRIGGRRSRHGSRAEALARDGFVRSRARSNSGARTAAMQP